MNEIVKIAAPMGEVLSAVSKAMAGVQKVGKTGTNVHDKYNFASIDDFLAMVNPVCAAAGLIFHMEEDGMEDFVRKGKFGDNAWMRVTFAVTAYHVSGQSLPPVRRTVEVLRNGAQAYGSAQSYALKQYLRSLLLIATGDKDDADYGDKDDGEIARPSATISAAQYRQIAELAERANVDLDKIAGAYRVQNVEELPADAFESAIKRLSKTLAEQPKPIDDEIPY